MSEYLLLSSFVIISSRFVIPFFFCWISQLARKLGQLWMGLRTEIIQAIKASFAAASSQSSQAGLAKKEVVVGGEKADLVGHGASSSSSSAALGLETDLGLGLGLSPKQLHAILREAWEVLSGLDKNGIFAHKVT